MKQLFQYAVLLHEYETTEKNGKTWKSSKIIIEPKFMLAKDNKEVVFNVTREISKEDATDPDNVQILVRNF